MVNGRAILVLLLLFGGLLGAYLLYEEPLPEPDFRVPPVEARDIDRVEIRRGDSEIVLQLRFTGGMSAWHIVKPHEFRADSYKVQEILSAIRFTPQRVLRPGREGWDPKACGLDPPGFTVRAFQGRASYELRFGNPVPTAPESVYVGVEGKDLIYLAPLSTRQAFEGALPQLRDRQLSLFDVYRTVKVQARRRYLRAQAGGPKEEVAEFEIVRDPAENRKGWHLVRPHEERLDDSRTGTLLSELSGLRAEEFRALDESTRSLLEKAEVIFEVHVAGGAAPRRIALQSGAGVPPGKALVRIDAEEEYAILPIERFRRLPVDFRHFRTDNPFDFESKDLESITLESAGERLVLGAERREGGEVSWRVAEPAGLSVDEAELESYLTRLFSVRISGYEAAQEDLRAFDLDPPRVTMRLRLAGEGERLYLFGRPGGREEGLLKKTGLPDLCRIAGGYVHFLSLLDLHFRKKVVFSAPRESIRSFTYEWRGLSAERFELSVRRRKEGGWEYVDERHLSRGLVPDPVRVEEILKTLGFLEAESYVGRGEESLGRAGLKTEPPPGRLVIESEKGGVVSQTILRISENLGRAESPLYYAFVEGSSVVFRLDARLLNDLRTDVFQRAVPEEKPPSEEP